MNGIADYTTNWGVEETLKKQSAFFSSGQTGSYSFRRAQLLKLREAILKNEHSIQAALRKDLGKSEFEAYFSEIGFVLAEIDLAIKKLKKWMRPVSKPSPLLAFYSKSYLLHEPYGKVLIIAPWNYPFQLLFAPLVGAIAAGNTAVLKPSEIAAETSALSAQIICEIFDKEYISIFEGGTDVATALLKEKFDYIFFTGGIEIGRIIYQAAAKHLTPVTLELGGKSPCIVHNDTDLEITARRIAWGKFINAGQTCIAPDYILVQEGIKDAFVQKMKERIKASFGDDAAQSKSYGRIVNERHFQRLEKLLEEDKILTGGQRNIKERYFAPTLMDKVSEDDPVMQEEIFGPILPIITYKNLDEALRFINSKPKPLALYLFTKSKAVEQKVLSSCTAGGVTINDTLMHIGNADLPFGGVGDSGIGAYHGKYSFEVFSHKKAVLKHYFFPDLKLRYAPYNFPLKYLKQFMRWFT